MLARMYAIGSGILAALSSICGKFAISQVAALDLCTNFDFEPTAYSSFCEQYLWTIRGVFFVLMIAINCVMWTTFTKALRYSSTSLEATITNTAANFFFTAILGQVLFDEMLTSLWWMGTVLIMCGLLLMHFANNPPKHKAGTRAKKFR